MPEVTTLPEAATIEHLDFQPPCELPSHSNKHPGDEAARYLVHADRCPDPAARGLPPQQFWICGPGWDRAGETGLTCVTCRGRRPRDEAWRILVDLGGPGHHGPSPAD